MPEGLVWEVTLSSNHCVCNPNVIECFPFVHCRLSTIVNAFGTTLCEASAAPFSVHCDGAVGKAFDVAKEEPGSCPRIDREGDRRFRRLVRRDKASDYRWALARAEESG